MLPLTHMLMNDLSATWKRWKEETFGSRHKIWHQGLDISRITRLQGPDRAYADAMLRVGRSLGDEDALEVLALLGDLSTLTALRASLLAAEPPPPATRVRTARLLHRIRPEPELAEHLIAVLRDPWSEAHPWPARAEAAVGLREFDGDEVEAALLNAVADPHYLVRYHACESLLVRYHAEPPRIAEHPQLFSLIRGPEDDVPSVDDLVRYASAARRLRALSRPHPARSAQ
ncbi:MAG TPA: hypothetical protein VIK91_00220 [Nannocystis sp.]